MRRTHVKRNLISSWMGIGPCRLASSENISHSRNMISSTHFDPQTDGVERRYDLVLLEQAEAASMLT
jgi:hypothetical protein